ncbi:carnitine O-acetyltransferase-like isoform X2 [Corticium candelabrum]|uniref:carnitine O-acetyltransferase-like isoform X2 n=1 Tax=Corticium candelabrum TaxID=121492 RepID=UPI002E26EF38|nr:carnitine O-acetyltransferase-like isoform X2 [Corticium candelabrum]
MTSLQQLKSVSDLPRLPVPPLQQTMDKYLRAICPLLSKEEMDKTKTIVDAFRKPGGEGEVLQHMLETRAKKHINWLADWWLHVAYLAFRTPVTVHVSPATMFPLMPQFYKHETRLKFISDYVTMMMKWKHLVDRNTISPLKIGNKEVCSSARKQLMGSCRLPYSQVDGQVVYQPHETRHIVVAHNCQFFEVDLFEVGSNTLLSPPQIYKQLEEVIKMSPDSARPPVSERVGLLTTDDRDTWTEARQRLTAESVNVKSLESIQRAVALICLDQANPDVNAAQNNKAFNNDQLSIVCSRGLHGNGVARNTGNRWYDKTMQLYFGSDGGCGTVLEHSFSDGLPCIALVDTLLDYCNNSSEARSWKPEDAEGVIASRPRQLIWNLSEQSKLDILKSAEKIDKLVDDTDLCVFVFKHFGKNFIKTIKQSPDAYIQSSWIRLYHEAVPSYESASTSQFQFGRTDTIRAATPESLLFTLNMDRNEISNEEKIALFKDAIAAHVKYTREAVAGQAIDRHLLGLKLSAQEAGLPMPSLFTDSSFGKVFSFKISTSQVPSKYELVLCFGPVVSDGYGICYNPREESIPIAISSFRSCSTTDSRRMVASLERALLDVHGLFSTVMKSKL